MITNKELDEMISKCKKSNELKELQTRLTNEIDGRITDKQALRILNEQHKLEEKEQEVRKGGSKII